MENIHERNVAEIKEFLDEHEVSYEQDGDNFLLNKDAERSYQIRYVVTEDYPVEYSKFGLDGVDKAHFYDLSKDAVDNDSFICWVKSFEWADDRKREVLKSYFLHAVGRTKNKFYARECEVRDVSTKQGREFEARNCFYGKRGASLSLGLYTKKEKNGVPKGTLIMIYTFGLNFFGKDRSVEILRVGTKRFSHVAGGASKLLKHFIKNYIFLKVGKHEEEVKKIIFYSDFDHNLGDSMSSKNGLGFEFVSYSGGGSMNYFIEEQVAKSRSPMHHKEIMEKIKNGVCIASPNAGVKTFVKHVEHTPEEIQGYWDKKKEGTLEMFMD